MSLRRGRRLLPWLFAAAVLGLLFARLPRDQVVRALAAGPFGELAALGAAMAVVALLADAAATHAAFTRIGVPRPFGQLVLARGATYLLGLLHPAAGQGALSLYLLRTGAEPGRAVAAVLLVFATQLGAMALVAAGGMLLAAGTAGPRPPWEGFPALALLLGVFGACLAVLRLRPRWLARWRLLAPLFAAGAGGFLAATLARVPHVLSMVVGLWLGLRLWGVALPPAQGLVLLSAVLLVTSLPLAPAGLGTTEAALVVLAAPYAPGAGAAARQSLVLAFCVLYHLLGLAAQAVAGLICLALLPRSAKPLAEPEGPGAAA